jgi:nitrite reductase (NO-forming)
MYGLILVEPEDGLPKVDKEFYLLQSEFYTKGKYGRGGLQPFSMEKALEEKPEYVVFNGSVGALVGDKALKVKVGDTIRLFVGNAGPNLVSSFHVIGEIFDLVHVEGGAIPNRNLQTTLVPSGGAAIVEFKVQVPGTYNIVDHSIFRAFNKGALGQIKVEGEEDKEIYSGKIRDEIYLAEVETIQKVTTPKVHMAKSKEERIKFGAETFKQICITCHQEKGQGIPDTYPPLAKSDYIKNKTKAIEAVVHGLEGKVKVNGKVFDNIMPPWELSDEEIANVLTFVYNSWGNGGTVVTTKEVQKVRKTPPKKAPAK